MKRRTFIARLGSAAAWPLAVRGQQGERVRRVGVLVGYEENDLKAKVWLSLFMQGLAELGWTDGRNLRMDIRWSGGDIDTGDCGGPAGNADDSDRLCGCRRPCW
jgi:putative ABC transport system substrate-binding protein